MKTNLISLSLNKVLDTVQHLLSRFELFEMGFNDWWISTMKEYITIFMLANMQYVSIMSDLLNT